VKNRTEQPISISDKQGQDNSVNAKCINHNIICTYKHKAIILTFFSTVSTQWTCTTSTLDGTRDQRFSPLPSITPAAYHHHKNHGQ